ncbi:V/A-type H+/Na+-transporting ATPase subunit K [Candidatus Hakubella thermalkaliphila]|uniref:V/A-type H+/Na+-transporting ATPase subunit K n=1 Tax=Candidatus Hakubella thermalkaliphila TaxID=2754717 RepID=A0A6V8NJV0_9ACTN|nr:V-type ATP synthase subunit K [Candidatus Hakubella thermalkaliphila]GFP19641.1 V/A-type H+/Na+-transporting ATPase subunit K [Candidatus Hakubella thermalkaliphila]GFP31012.1 V/A-type H+/Na+-transporting ATPase subunit K [Candidatus Hakubella thermalkaliphila]GFP37727.1 V/A-type H+/Na+-transporting ATPase subunit K [Candidatus Hakubella thermalkaliphila]GFP41040.1 V/A-type H+/Na+-transporting ATPase subunit K [Candidatus Hakubella thermalkaliphila]
MQDTVLLLSGSMWAVLGAALAAMLAGVGSGIGITSVAKFSAGLLSEDPDKFGRLLVLIVLPGTQGIYGFIIAILVIVFFDLLGGGGANLSAVQGFQIFVACLPVAIAGLITAIYQGIVSTAAAAMAGKREETLGKAIVLPAMVETYAVLALITTIFLLMVAAA